MVTNDNAPHRTQDGRQEKSMIKVNGYHACLPSNRILKLRHDQTLHDRAIRRNSPPIKVSLAEEDNGEYHGNTSNAWPTREGPRGVTGWRRTWSDAGNSVGR